MIFFLMFPQTNVNVVVVRVLELKYVVMINNTPIPIVRRETEEKIIKKTATLKDIKEELEFIIENLNEILVQPGVLEVVKYLSEVFDLRAYTLTLKNILGMLKKGEARPAEVSVLFKPTKMRLSVDKAYETPLASVTELGTINLEGGIIYMYSLSLSESPRSGGLICIHKCILM